MGAAKPAPRVLPSTEAHTAPESIPHPASEGDKAPMYTDSNASSGYNVTPEPRNSAHCTEPSTLPMDRAPAAQNPAATSEKYRASNAFLVMQNAERAKNASAPDETEQRREKRRSKQALYRENAKMTGPLPRAGADEEKRLKINLDGAKKQLAKKGEAVRKWGVYLEENFEAQQHPDMQKKFKQIKEDMERQQRVVANREETLREYQQSVEDGRAQREQMLRVENEKYRQEMRPKTEKQLEQQARREEKAARRQARQDEQEALQQAREDKKSTTKARREEEEAEKQARREKRERLKAGKKGRPQMPLEQLLELAARKREAQQAAEREQVRKEADEAAEKESRLFEESMEVDDDNAPENSSHDNGLLILEGET